MPDQHMAEQMARVAPVLYVDPLISRRAGRRNAVLAASLDGPRLRLIGPSLARLTPIGPPGTHRPVIRRLSLALVRRSLSRAVRALDADVHATVLAGLQPLFGSAGEKRRVLYGTDDFVAGAELMGLPVARLRRLESRILGEADVVVAVSQTLLDHWARPGRDVRLIPNGVDYELFAGTDEAALPEDVTLPPPIAGFIGHLSTRIDVALLEAVAARGHSVLLVGPRQLTFELLRMTTLLDRPNVQWVGPKPFADLPSYMRVIDVGLVPYADSPFNRASFPLKTLEYLAGGRGAVSTSLPSVLWLDSDLITRADGPDAFADATAAALGSERTPDLVQRRRTFAARHSWARRAETFADVLELAPPVDRISDDAESPDPAGTPYPAG